MLRHEVERGVFEEVDVKLSNSNGTKINAPKCSLRITNKHVYIKSSPTTYTVVGKGDKTFSETQLNIVHCHPHRFIQPWFGPYRWETVVSGSVPNVEPQSGAWSLLLTFSSGSAFEYRKTFLMSFGDASQAAQEGMDELLPAYTP